MQTKPRLRLYSHHFATWEKGYEGFKPIVPNIEFLYSLKTSENRTILCFQGLYKCNKWEQGG